MVRAEAAEQPLPDRLLHGEENRGEQDQERHELAEDLLRIGRDCAARLPKEVRALDPDSLLYDERGLPK